MVNPKRKEDGGVKAGESPIGPSINTLRSIDLPNGTSGICFFRKPNEENFSQIFK